MLRKIAILAGMVTGTSVAAEQCLDVFAPSSTTCFDTYQNILASRSPSTEDQRKIVISYYEDQFYKNTRQIRYPPAFVAYLYEVREELKSAGKLDAEAYVSNRMTELKIQHPVIKVGELTEAQPSKGNPTSVVIFEDDNIQILLIPKR